MALLSSIHIISKPQLGGSSLKSCTNQHSTLQNLPMLFFQIVKTLIRISSAMAKPFFFLSRTIAEMLVTSNGSNLFTSMSEEV